MATEEMSELDYHITFPSPVSLESYEGQQDDGFATGERGSREPVVILLGWAGCQEKHLSKYSSIYEQNRCITIMYTPPAEEVYALGPRLKPYAYKILELLFDLNIEQNPLLFHVFSNGGACLYRYITRAIAEGPAFQSVALRGIIFDSAPGIISSSRAAQAIVAPMGVHSIFKILLSAFYTVYLTTVGTMRGLLRMIGILQPPQPTIWEDIVNDPARCPQLFLYSKADDLISYKDIDECIAERRALGVDVREVCWEDSGHVAHLRAHREPYMTQCYRFLDFCIAGSNEDIGAGTGASIII